MVGGQQAGQAGVGGAVAVVVGPHGHHHAQLPVTGLRGLDQGAQEGGPLSLVAAGGEHLLELVDDQQQPPLCCDGRPQQQVDRS
jgi:hypothetical protein